MQIKELLNINMDKKYSLSLELGSKLNQLKHHESENKTRRIDELETPHAKR